jgi:hypothetical protein
MKWIGQHIYDLVARFRNDVYLEDLSTTTETNVLVVDSDGKVSKNTTTIGDITGITEGDNITVTDPTGPVPTVALSTNVDVAGTLDVTGLGTFDASVTVAGDVGIGTATPVNKLDIVGSFGRGAPVTKTTDFTVAATENWLIMNGTATITITLPTASDWTGRELMIKNIAAYTVISASSNVKPIDTDTAATAILPEAVDSIVFSSWCTLVSDGTYWVTMMRG